MTKAETAGTQTEEAPKKVEDERSQVISQLKVGAEALAERLSSSDLSIEEIETVIGKLLPCMRVAVDTCEIQKWTQDFVAANTQKGKCIRLSVLSTKCD